MTHEANQLATDIAWENRDDVTVPLDAWNSPPCGTQVQTKDGREWTIVYHNLDGLGVIEGRHNQYGPGTPNDELPEPEALLRKPFKSASYPCVGDQVIVLFQHGTQKDAHND